MTAPAPMTRNSIVRLAGVIERGNLLWMATPNLFRGFRYPVEVIERAVWLYNCFCLSLREVELTLAARGVVFR